MDPAVTVIGGGLAGSEAAWQIARAGLPVVLYEMRPGRRTEAHKTGKLAELVCSNSFRSDDAANNAVGLLHEEMRRCGSLVMVAADAHKLPAGQLELLTGINERRWWEPGYKLSQGASAAARKALAASNFNPKDVDILIYAGVCREQYEPATACVVAANVGVSTDATVYDLSNA